jgi:hypothetical protein
MPLDMPVTDDNPDTFDERALPAQLDLLVPWELPDAGALPTAQRSAVAEALTALRTALNSANSDATTIARIIHRLPGSLSRTHQPEDTRSPLSQREVEEYDRYFLINHVDSETPALTMVRSLLLSSQVFVAICDSSTGLDGEQIELQRQGFLAHVDLLRRVFDLDGAS